MYIKSPIQVDIFLKCIIEIPKLYNVYKQLNTTNALSSE